MIEIYLLEQLIAFSEHGTLSDAADALHLTQPTLTRSMKKLEDELNVPLFTREKKRISLNENGRLAAELAKNVQQAETQMIEQVRAKDRLARTVTVGSCAPGPIMELLPLLSGAFSQHAVLTELNSEKELLRGLRDNTYQLIILSYAPDDADLYAEKCGSEKLCANFVPTHPLAKRRSVSFHDLNGENFLVASEVGIWEERIRNYMPDSKFFLQGDVDDLLEVTKNSTLSGFSTDLTLRVLGQRGNRVHIPISDAASFIEFYFVCKAADQKRYDGLFATLKDRVQ